MALPQRIEPGPGQESVWDYPRPPKVEPTPDHVVVVHRGVTIADSTAAFRVLETSQPPAFYLPPADVAVGHLVPSTHRTFCEWKGTASYFDLRVADDVVRDAAWTYLDPMPDFSVVTGYVAFYAQRVDACYVDGERVLANDGSFYGGWITSKVVGPFKGAPGTLHW